MRKGNETPWKKSETIKRIFPCKLVLIGLIAFILMLNLARADLTQPEITDAQVDPLKVQPGDVLITTVEFKDDYGIVSAIARYEHESGTDEIPMSLIKGDKLKGTYKAAWVVHDTEIKKYYTTVYLTNKLDLTSMRKLEWWDPEVGHSASAISADTFDSGNFTFQDDLYVNDRLGLGTSNPQQKLNIVGELNVTQGLNLSMYQSCTALETDSAGNVLCGIDESGFEGVQDYTNIAMTNQSNSFGNYDQTFDTDTLFIDSAEDRIGIGTIYPQQKLNVVGGLNVSNATATALFVDEDTSYVGIGTTSPTQALEVNGNINISTGSDGDLYVYDDVRVKGSNNPRVDLWKPASGNSAFINFYSDGVLKAGIGLQSGSTDLGFINESNDVIMTIKNDGNVGIGDTSPESKLTVAGAIRVHGEYYRGAVDNWTALAADTDVYLDMDDDNDGSNKLYIRNGANTKVMEVDESGNLQMDGDLTVSGGYVNLPYGNSALESRDEWLRINEGGGHSQGIYMGSVLGVGGNTYIGGYSAATGEIDLLTSGDIDMVGTLTAADIECTNCIDTGDLKTSTGIDSGSCNKEDAWNLIMNDYSFFPNFGDDTTPGHVDIGGSYNSITTDDTVGRIVLVCSENTGIMHYENRWRYVTASRPPEIFVWYDLENGILKHIWRSEIEHPEILPVEYDSIPKDINGNPLLIPVQITVFDKNLLEMNGYELMRNYTITRYEKSENLSADDELLTKPKEEGAVLITHPDIHYGKLEYCSTCADSLLALENNSSEQEKPAMPMATTEENQTVKILENQQKIQELETRLATLENMIEQSNGSVIIKVK